MCLEEWERLLEQIMQQSVPFQSLFRVLSHTASKELLRSNQTFKSFTPALEATAGARHESSTFM
jgi:hypothetical protein